LTYPLLPGRSAWVQIVNGEIRLISRLLSIGDGDAVEGKPSFDLVALEQHKTELLLIDLA
jgi:redox-sensitive bicupin YhaK (pirin superfamily)